MPKSSKNIHDIVSIEQGATALDTTIEVIRNIIRQNDREECDRLAIALHERTWLLLHGGIEDDTVKWHDILCQASVLFKKHRQLKNHTCIDCIAGFLARSIRFREMHSDVASRTEWMKAWKLLEAGESIESIAEKTDQTEAITRRRIQIMKIMLRCKNALPCIAAVLLQ
jgi:hypothetical protein